MTDREAIKMLQGCACTPVMRRAINKGIKALQEREERSKPVKLKYTGFDEIYCPWGDCPVCGAENIMTNKFCCMCGRPLKGEDEC